MSTRRESRSSSRLPPPPSLLIVATWPFGRIAVRAGWKAWRAGGTLLDAVERGARAVEDAPGVDSVGTGGLPNREGVVELDACIMDGRTKGFGSVAGLRRIANPVSVARRVMERTPHLMLVGEGAFRFARAQGFPPASLLTPSARRAWLRWRRSARATGRDWHDTVGVLAADLRGHFAGSCSTSGMPWKLPGRVGDSPLIGNGLYVDDAVGAAAATGVGEEIMRAGGTQVVIEAMRRGASAMEACREIARRVAERSRRDPHQPGAGFLAIDRSGRVGACGVHRGYFRYAVCRSGRFSLRLAPGVLPSRSTKGSGLPSAPS